MTSFRVKKKTADLDSMLKVWDKTIDVQMHFNELQMKVRNFSILLISSLVGVGGLALKENITTAFSLWGIHANLSLASIVFFVAIVVWIAFFFMDHFWYYPLLVGAVKHGLSIESELAERLPSLGLTGCIGKASPLQIGSREIHSKHKSLIFYGIVFIGLAFLTYSSASSLAKPLQATTANAPAQPNTNNAPFLTTTSTATNCQDAQMKHADQNVTITQNFYNGNSAKKPKIVTTASDTLASSPSTIACK